jgi:hypothetical protein
MDGAGTHDAGLALSVVTGTPIEERNVRHVFKRMLENAPLRQIRIHDLRHRFASLLFQQGESVVYVKEQLGHASIRITVDTCGISFLGRIVAPLIAWMTSPRRIHLHPRRVQARLTTSRSDARSCVG